MMKNNFYSKNWFSRMVLCACACWAALTGCSKTDETYYEYDTQLNVFGGSSYDYLVSQPELYDSMLLVLDRVTGLKDSLQNGNVSLFAVSNYSFELAMEKLNLQRRTVGTPRPALSLSTLDSTQLDTLLSRYILRGEVLTDSVVSFSDGRLVPSIKYDYNMNLKYERVNAGGYVGGGPQQLFFSDPKRTPFEIFWVTTKTQIVNLRTDNGIVHVLSSGHDFGFGDEFIQRMDR